MFEDEQNNNSLDGTSTKSKINNLNEWQESLKKGLKEKQEAQKRRLKLEHAAAYEKLGLVNNIDNNDESLNSPAMPESQKEIDSNNLDGRPELLKNSNESGKQKIKERRRSKNVGGDTNRSNSAARSANESLNNELEPKSQNLPPKNFLKKGDGLRQRFKVDPSAYKLNNLPKYKFANAHPHLRSKGSRKTLKLKSSPSNDKLDKGMEIKEKQFSKLDPQEEQFQKTLMLSKNICSSTPDARSSGYGSMVRNPAEAKVQTQPSSPVLQKIKPNQSNEDSEMLGAACFEKHEDSDAQGDEVEESILAQPPVYGEELPQDELDTLNMFELLEEQVKDGSIDVNSELMARLWKKNIENQPEIEADDSNIEYKNSNDQDLDPSTCIENLSDCYTSGEDDDDVSTQSKEIEYEKSDRDTGDSVDLPENLTDNKYVDESCSLGDKDQYANSISSGCIQEGDGSVLDHFRQVLFDLLNKRAQKAEADLQECDSVGNVTMKVDSQSNISGTETRTISIENDTIPAELNAVKERNKELEREVSSFKEANKELVTLKQEFELEKSLFQQEREEALKEMNDIRIKFEMYMHDERIKLEEERQKMEQQIRTQRISKQNKDRAAVAQLKEEVEKLNVQIKQKEQNHAVAQARLRAQISKLEREQKCLLDEMEALKKENKRLESEILRIQREKNNKLLDEINKNIAKLTPKTNVIGALETQKHPPSANVQTLNQPAATERQKVTLKKKGAKSNADRKIKSPESKKLRPKQLGAPLNTPIVQSSSDDDDGGKHETSQKENFSPDSSPNNLKNIDNNQSNIDEEGKITEIERPCKTYLDKMTSFTPETFTRATSTTRIVDPQESSVVQTKETTACASTSTEFNREIINPDGSKDIWYSNGNVKKLSADRMHIRMLYFNKDIKETDIEKGTVRYYYASTNTWHTTYLDGLEILEFPNGQSEHRFKNGVIETHFPNHSVKVVDPNDKEVESQWHFEDGTKLKHMHNGEKILILPNGQREVHTKLCKRREYPDGTVKIVYPDGSQETRYSNGRVRLKDKSGKLVMDSDNAVRY